MNPRTSKNRRYTALLTLIAALAFFLRFLTANGELIRPHLWGDSTRYIYYAFNLYKHSMFSSSPIGTVHPVADGFDSPMYPFFIALLMRFSGSAWFTMLLGLQCLLGAMTVILSAALARRSFGEVAALGVALVVAFWPHLVVISAWVLTETLFGTLVMAALWVSVRLAERGGKVTAMGAGLLWGVAALTNPVATLIPLLLALPIWRLRGWRIALLLAITGLILPAVWSVRNQSLPAAESSSGRALMNFVQGSWPEYHKVILIGRTPQDAVIAGLINKQVGLTIDHPAEGFEQIWKRLSSEPTRYLEWYFLHKPFLLWDWSIRVGWAGPDGIEIAPLAHSPYRFIPFMGASLDLYRTLNPLVFVLALLGVCLSVWRWTERSPGLVFSALTVVYVTMVYAVLQAEPRYSIPYRPLEVLLAFAGAGMLWRALQLARRRINRTPDT